MTRNAFFLASLVCVQACIGPSGQQASSASSAAEMPKNPNAGLLLGAADMVDGQPLLDGWRSEVVAGCHVIRTSPDLVITTPEIEVRGRMPPVDIVVSVSPGHRYIVERKIEDPTAQLSRVAIYVREEDMRHRAVRTFLPVRDVEQQRACQPNVAGRIVATEIASQLQHFAVGPI